ncbi:innexin shaking-B isoform X2 [Folsomia candida]|uniref:innexin shaking-B isoform X2 n=1 Tax=Folsomia candida TaxID=158441 RepID=UPI000B9093D3|nr:innexin shaking-B isoform X2 [Folsomia candida]
MLDIFRGLKNLVKVSHVRIDSSIFRLHYSLTVMILLAFSLIVTTRQYVGNPIDCIHTKDIPEDVLNTYCWIMHTYLVKSAFLKRVGKEVMHFGIDQSPTDESDMKVYKYYQWVCFCLFFQAILFYVPRWLWKNWEGGKIQSLMMDLDIGIIPEMEKKQKKKLLVDYLYDNLKQHNWWAYRYFFCEILALGNVIGQAFLMDKFFDGEFLTFGLEVMRLTEEDEDRRIDPMIRIFPRMTKCTFRKGGPSWGLETHDALCILPINAINEKTVAVVISPRIRGFLLGSRFRLLSQDAIQTLVKKSRLGDWFLFYLLGQNVDSIIFRDIMHELARRLGHPKDFGEP